MNLRQPRRPRYLHPGAWWLWALGLAVAASRTTNPILLGMLLAVAGFVVMSRRAPGPAGGAFRAFLIFGLAVIVGHVLLQVVFGSTVPGTTVLLDLPEIPLPAWLAGVRLGGPVTLEAVVLAVYDGLRLATILACLGAANALGDPRRLLRSMPGAVYELGVAAVVALTFAPRLVEDLMRVRSAQRLRGHNRRPLRDLGRIIIPVLESSLDNAIDLAASMDSRGFGRQQGMTLRDRRISGVLLMVGLFGVCAGLYGVFAAVGDAASLSVLVVGIVAAIAGLATAGNRSQRTRYRPDPWDAPEWLVVTCGSVVAVTFSLAAAQGAPGMNLMVVPLVAPAIPAVALLGALVALLPAWVSPPVPVWHVASTTGDERAVTA